jgi:hypothetical protein
MRKRNYVMGLVAAMAISIAVPVAAHAAIVGTTLTTTVSKTKQQKKVHGGTGIDFLINTTHTFPEAPPLQTAYLSNVDLDSNFKVTGKGNKIDNCNPSRLQTALTPDQAKAACPSKSLSGSGDATTCSANGTCGNPTTGSATHGGTVTIFNGVASGGVTNLLLHVDLVAGANPLVIDGKSGKSPLGSPYGTRLTFQVPDSSSTGQELTVFHAIIDQVLANRKKTKNGVEKKYLLAAKCSGDKVWQFRADFFHRNGGPTTVGTSEVPCKVKAAPKK